MSKKNVEAIYPLSPAQQGMLFHSLYAPGEGVYIEQITCVLHGDVQPAAFRAAWQRIIDQHAILRTLFLWERRDKPLQVVRAQVDVPWQSDDWRGLTTQAQHERLAALLQADRAQGFDLATAPLLRVQMIQLAPDAYQLVLSYHHLLMDAWSFALLFREVIASYAALCNDQQLRLAPRRPYRDYITWLQQQDLSEAEAFWRRALQGFSAPTPLAIDRLRRLRPPQQDGPSELRVRLSVASSAALQTFARQHHLTLNTLVQAAWGLLLSRYSGETDILFGTVVSGRPSALSGVEAMVGPFINTLVVRLTIDRTARVLPWLQQIQQQQTELRQFEYSPLVQVQSWSEIPRGMPLFESILAFESQPVDTSAQAQPLGLEISDFRLIEKTNYPLTVRVVPGAELLFWIDYDGQRFDADSISRMLSHFQTLLIGLAADPERRLGDVPLLSQAERREMLDLWPSDQIGSTPDVCLHHLFEAQAERTPDAIALSYEDATLSYGELNRRANQLAHTLRAHGVGGETCVGLCLDRSPELVVAVLAVLKAGGAYVPLDPAYPQERLGWILDDAAATVLVTQRALADRFDPARQPQVIYLDDWDATTHPDRNPISAATADNAAYVIYTSGSTGRPKGVVVTHRNVTRLFTATQHWFQFGADDVWTLFHSYAFDFSVWELWGALLHGGRLVVVPYLVSRAPDAFAALLDREQVTVLNQTPAAFRQLMHTMLATDQELPALRYVVFGGEALDLPSLQPWFARYGDRQPQLVNMYGITETTVHVTYRPLSATDLSQGLDSVIGGPIPDLQTYLLDPFSLEPVPPGVVGELYVGGAGVARGYLNRPALTAERFVPDSLSTTPGARLYKTGDTARYLPDSSATGELEYVGRSDQQVKIRGFRIELGEIQAALEEHPAVRESLVTTYDDGGERRLVAYVVGAEPRTKNQEPGGGSEGTKEQRNKGSADQAVGSQFSVLGSSVGSQFSVLGSSVLHEFLQTRLPAYMVPASFVILDALPLTTNGKLDRAALPAPDKARPDLDQSFAPPRTATEQALATIWAEVLGLEQVGVHDSFFVLGGDSIRSIQVLARAREHGLSLTLHQLFEHPTIAALSQQLDQATAETDDATPVEPFSLIQPEDQRRLPADLADAYPLTRLQLGMLFHSELHPDRAVYHDIFSFHLRVPLELPLLHTAADQLAAQHAILRTSFDLASFSEPLQLVHAATTIPIQVTDISALTPAEQNDTVQRWIADEKRRPFDWTQPPLLRFALHQRGEREAQFAVSFHHAILDGWSVASLLVELFQRYFALLNQQPAAIAPPQAQFRDLVVLERAALSSEAAQRYWTTTLRDATITRLPRWSLRQHDSAGSSVGVHVVPIQAALLADLQRLAQAAETPLKSVLLAAHLRVLGLLSGQRDVLTGLVAHTRPETPDGERVVGLFLNTLPLRIELQPSTWRELVQATFAAEQAALPFRWYPLAELQQQHGGQPLFETAFNFTHFHVYQGLQQFSDVEVVGANLFQETNFAYQAHVNIDADAVQAHLSLEYDATQFDARQIELIAGYYAAALAAMVDASDEPGARRIDAATLLSVAEQQQVVRDWNTTAVSYPREQTLVDLLLAQAARTPDAIAVVAEDRQLSYAELDQRSNQLAHHLRTLGVGPETLVGVCLDRSLDLVVALLGVLKAGGAYVPIDPDYPDERRQFMLHDAAAPVLLTEQRLRPISAPDTEVLCLDRDWPQIAAQPHTAPSSALTPANLAYVIYTSGSTGQPKGALNTHGGIRNRLLWMQQRYGLTPTDRVLQKTPVGFDVSVWEFFWPLITGAALVLARPGGQRDPGYLIELIRRQRITTLHFVPSMLQVFLQEPGVEECTTLRRVICSGEALTVDLQQRFFARSAAELHNLYGPTEAAVDVSAWACVPDAQRSVPIGRPIANTQLYVLDAQMQPAPIGVAGELYIGGVQVARGYLNRPALTAERFVPDPFSSQTGARLYRTGDRVCWTADGVLDYLGRLDDQIKLRGFRIELGEIESVLRQLPAVSDAAVVLRRTATDEHELVAYVVEEPHAEPRTKNQEPGEGSEGTTEQRIEGTREQRSNRTTEQPNNGATEQADTADGSQFSVLGSSNGSQFSVLGSAALRTILRERLPDYMIPATFVLLDALPLTPNGKLDRRALPEPSRRDAAALAERAPVMPRSEIEQRIAAIWQQVLQVEQVGVHDNFFDLGGHSLRLVQVRSKLREALDREITMTDLLTYPTISTLAQHLADPKPTATADSAPQRATATRRHSSNAIAIAGIACAVPGARTPDAFWQQVRDGVESIAFFSDEELAAAGVAPELLSNPNYVKACPLLEEIDRFDAAFFGFTPREAELMDPQQRLFLEYAWAALEDAGYGALGATERGNRIGVFAGMSLNSYLLVNLASNTELIAAAGGLQTLLANDKDFLPTRVSYKLNLKGPSINVQSACSTSLVAVHLACQSLLNDECDAALAGGVSIRAFDKTGYLYEEGGISSPDGHCRAFDAEASGTVSGNGLGVVVLKRLADAEADGDTIYAVIKGTAINNDGALKVGYTAPSVAGQAEVIAGALAAAGVPAETIGYVEAHGTATPLGDPIELAALSQVYRSQTAEQQFCAIGSVKTNLGHLDAAAGVIGLIKTALALKHQQLPPSLHFERPNPQIELAISPFYVNTTLQPWPRGTNPRRAGVSSFGIGGTNVHLVLEEAPAAARVQPAADSRPAHLLVLSAKTSASLDQATANLADYFAQQPDADLADVAYTLQVGRTGFNHRRVLVCSDAEDARSALLSLEPSRVTTVVQEPIERPVAFMFPGGGAQYVNMSRELYASEPRFRQAIDRCADLLLSLCDLDLRAVLYPAPERLAEMTREIERTSIALPALFAVEYALAQLWIDWGVRPQALIGHSLGEYVAATLAGVFSLEDALQLVVLRGQLFEQLPAGGMLSVALAEHELLPLIEAEPQLSIAALNGPQLSVVAGPADAIDQLGRQLTERGVECQRLHIAVAAHSALVTPILEPFAAFVERLSLHKPAIPFLSNVSGTWITAEEATDPRYWVTHLRQTVRFAAGIQTLLEQRGMVVLEVGPGRTLSSLARQHASPDQLVLSSLRHPRDRISDPVFLLQTLGRLWQARVTIDWPRVVSDPLMPELRRRVPLPTYPFERQRYWVEPRRQSAGDRTLLSKPPAQISSDDWLYLPWWERTMPPSSAASEHIGQWLIFADELGLGSALAERLTQTGQRAITVRSGQSFGCVDSSSYTIDPQSSADYRRLLTEIGGASTSDGHADALTTIVHCWSVAAPQPDRTPAERLAQAQTTGYHSLQLLVQALATTGRIDTMQRKQSLRLAVISNGLHAVSDGEPIYPEKATLLGLCKVMPQEYPDLTCQSIDATPPRPGTRQAVALADLLCAELSAPAADDVLAYRGSQRWVQRFQPLPSSPAPAQRTALRERGVYMITGGLGGIGLVLAEHLARTVQARLVLVGRTALPDRGEWDDLLAQHPDTLISRKLRAVLAIEAHGGGVLLAAADVADAEQMTAVVAEAEQRFGAIHGVIHAAGLPGGGLIQLKSAAQVEAVFAPKVQGVLVLDALFADRPLDFMLLWSSLGTILGGLGQADYCAANAFLDAYAQFAATARSNVTLAVNWDRWQQIGMALPLEAEHRTRTGVELSGGMSSAEGCEMFERVLGISGPAQIVVAPRDLPSLIAGSRATSAAGLLEALAQSQSSRPTHPRPALASSYVEPSSEVERQIATVWQDVLGIDQIGIHDNFFELGGHSLLATQVMSRLRNVVRVELPLHHLFEQPTVAELATLVVQQQVAQADQQAIAQLLAEIQQLSQHEAQQLLAAERQSSERDVQRE